jgi:gliding motility-associated-like protein
MKKILLLISFLSLVISGSGQITTSINPTIAQMQAALQGNGVVVTGLTITCPAGAYGMFNNGAAALGAGLNSGILLTTGTASNVAGPMVNTTSNNLSFDNNTNGSALGNTLSGGTTYDACFINFMITPNCSTLSIKYVFASEEYPEFSTGTINDVFGFVISGPNPLGGNYAQQNISVLPTTTTGSNVVSIQNVNNGTSNTGPCVNCGYYVAAPPGLEYDGKTTVLTASANVTPCQTYTMTIGVWDDSDHIYDSGVFLDVNGLSCVGNPTITAAVSPSVICGPQTVTLTAGGGIASGTYTWSAPASGGLGATVGATVIANPTAPTVYTVSYSDLNTCPGVPLIKTTTLSFSPSPPLPVSSNPTSICAGQTTTLTSNGGAGTYSWTPGASLSSTTGSVVVASPTVTTTYTVTKTAGGCVSTTVITVPVTSASGLTVTPNGGSICPGQSLSMLASGGASYTWTASSGANPPSSASITVNPATTTSYTVTSTCSSSAAVTVTVSAAPSVTVSPATISLCTGQSATLTASGGSTYTWTASSGANPPNTANVTVSPATTTTYTVVTGVGTCTASATSTVTVGAAGSVTVTPTNTTICSGQSAALTATGGTTYTWTASSGTNPTNTANVTVTPTTTTSYTVITGLGTCTTSAVASVSVSPGVTVTATPAATTICNGGSGVGITASGATSYTWIPTTGLSSATGANVTANPTSSTIYTITGSNGVCTSSAVANVSVTTVSTTVTASAVNYCIGGSPVTLTASGATTYAWSPATGLSSTTGAVVTATPAVTTVYTVVGTTGSCTSTKTITVTVPPTSTITVVNTGTVICAGGSTTLTASGANTYTWLPTGGNTSVNNASPGTTTTYTVAGNTASGCFAVPALITVSVSPAITPVITSASATVCLSQTVAMSVTPTGAGLTYLWNPATDIQGPNNTASIIAKPATAGSITYSVTVSNGVCISTATVNLDALSCTPPTATIQATTNDSICTNGCVTFTANVTGSQPMTYQWLFPGGTPPTSNLSNPTICYGAKGSYTVGLIVANAYGSDTTYRNNYISVADTPRVFNAGRDTTLNVGQTTTLHANGVGASYHWYPNSFNSIACPTCSNTIVQPSVTTTYYVEISNSPYCKRRDSVIVKVDFVCGDFFVPNAFSPNGDGLNDLANVHGFCVGTYNLQIFNRWGEKVFETTSMSDSWDGSFRGKNMDTGVFVYRADGVTIDGKPFSIKGNITLIR